MYPGVGTFVLIRPAQTFYERIKVRGERVRRVSLELRNCRLEFRSPLGAGPLAEFLARYGEAIYQLSLKVRDLPAATAFLAGRGIPTAEVTTGANPASAVITPEYAHGVRFVLLES